MKAMRANSIEEAVENVKKGAALVSFYPHLLHDNPPGDWYKEVDLICASEEVATMIEGAKLANPRRKEDESGFPRFTATYMTHLGGGPLVQPSPSTIEAEAASLAPYLEETANRVMSVLADL